jgi:hypothetical protein
VPRIVRRTLTHPPKELAIPDLRLDLGRVSQGVGDLPVDHDPKGRALLPQQLDWPPDQFGGQFQLSAELRGSRTSRARQTQTCRDRACRVVAPAASVIESGSCGSLFRHRSSACPTTPSSSHRRARRKERMRSTVVYPRSSTPSPTRSSGPEFLGISDPRINWPPSTAAPLLLCPSGRMFPWPNDRANQSSWGPRFRRTREPWHHGASASRAISIAAPRSPSPTGPVLPRSKAPWPAGPVEPRVKRSNAPGSPGALSQGHSGIKVPKILPASAPPHRGS